MSFQTIFARKDFSTVMAFLWTFRPLCLLLVYIFSVLTQVARICGFIWADITFSECFWLCHSTIVLSHMIVVIWLSNKSLITLLTCERSFVMCSKLVNSKESSSSKHFPHSLQRKSTILSRYFQSTDQNRVNFQDSLSLYTPIWYNTKPIILMLWLTKFKFATKCKNRWPPEV